MSLATLSTSADPESVQKIIDLMHKIKTALTTSLKEDQTQEETAASDWVVEKASIENTIATLNSEIHDLKTDIGKFEDRIQEAKDIIKAQETTRDQEIQLLEDETTWCSEEDTLYSTADNERKQILDLIDQVIAALEDNFNAVEDYLRDRVNGSEFVPTF